MNYSEYKIKYETTIEYKFMCFDIEDNEFVGCDGCGADVPLHKFVERMSSVTLCELCANNVNYDEKEKIAASFVGNFILRKIGKFDDNEVIVIDPD